MRSFACLLPRLLGVAGAAAWLGAAEPVGPPHFENDFEKADPGKLPEGFTVLDGAFSVQEKDGRRYLELPGAPLDTFGLLFGPTFAPGTGTGLSVSGRFYGSRQGRRYPAFAIGLCGAGGYRLQIAPAKQAVELHDGDQIIASQPYAWKSDSWTSLRLQIRKSDGQWLLQGNAWPADQPEPATWLITQPASQEPASGRPSLWGMPYSGQPIRFDDLLVRPST